MKEVIVKLTSDHIKVKGAEYMQDLVRCQDCKHWAYNFNGAKTVSIGYTTSTAVQEIRVPNRGMRQTDVHMENARRVSK